jgi:ribosomal protein L7Ae-like RNA K-turn-binding protein
MSLKDLKDALKEKKVGFGLKQALKTKKGKKKVRVFVAKDVRNETLDKLQENNINFEFLKTKKEISKELGLDFESEVFLIE